VLNPGCGCKTRARTTYATTTVKQRLLIRAGLEVERARCHILHCDCKKHGQGQHTGTWAQPSLQAFWRWREKAMWQIAAAIMEMTYGTSSQTNELEMERSGDVSDRVSNNNKGRGGIRQVKCRKQQQPKRSWRWRGVRSSTTRAEMTYSNGRSSSQRGSGTGSSRRNFRQNSTLSSSSSSDNQLEQQENSVHLGW
jgi:hypothetical protein